MLSNQQLPLPVEEVIPAFRRVTGGTTGVRLADVEPFLGTNIEDRDPAVPNYDIATIQPVADGFHFATIGNNTAVSIYGEIQAAADGKVVAKTTGVAIGRVLQDVPANSNGGTVRVIYYSHANPSDPVNKVVAAGIHTWAGGADTTDSIPVVGLLDTDVVICTLVARASTETLALAVNDAANDQIDLTLGANGTDGTTKVSYIVLR